MNDENVIKRIILEMDIPFKLSDLFLEMSHCGIEDKIMILDVLDSLINSGLVEYSDFEDDANVFCSALV